MEDGAGGGAGGGHREKMESVRIGPHVLETAACMQEG